MIAVKNPTAARLFKKLSALRMTLPNDERKLLDTLLLEDAGKLPTMHATRVAKPQIQFDQISKEYRLAEEYVFSVPLRERQFS